MNPGHIDPMMSDFDMDERAAGWSRILAPRYTDFPTPACATWDTTNDIGLFNLSPGTYSHTIEENTNGWVDGPFIEHWQQTFAEFPFPVVNHHSDVIGYSLPASTEEIVPGFQATFSAGLALELNGDINPSSAWSIQYYPLQPECMTAYEVDEALASPSENAGSGQGVQSSTRVDQINSAISNRAYARENPEYSCAECDFTTDDSWDFYCHASKTKHKSYSCWIGKCNHRENKSEAVNDHVIQNHLKTCSCGLALESVRLAHIHQRASQHHVFRCFHEGCTATFDRFDVLKRHITNHDTGASRFPCHLCKKHRGPKAFKRRDHLKQHRWNYHMIRDEGKPSYDDTPRYSCPHEECSDYCDPSIAPYSELRAFDKISKLTEHLKKVHDESKFPCSVAGCDRVGGKGYFREKDLQKHMVKVHAEDKDEE